MRIVRPNVLQANAYSLFVMLGALAQKGLF